LYIIQDTVNHREIIQGLTAQTRQKSREGKHSMLLPAVTKAK